MKIQILAGIGILSLASGLTLSSARADGSSCLPYYQSYVSQLEYALDYGDPAPGSTQVIIIAPEQRYHRHDDHHREDHRGDRGGDRGGHHGGDSRSDDSGDAAAVIAIALGITTTAEGISTTVREQELNGALNIENVILQAQLGDGIELNSFADKVRKEIQKLQSTQNVTLAQVAQAVNTADQNLTFCQSGNLDTENQLAKRIASDLK